MQDKALEFMRGVKIPEKGAGLTVGVSGGADSVALLYFLRGICQEWGIGLKAAHLNHNLRGEESARDESFVRRICGEWGIGLTVKSADIAKLAAQRGLSVEECARDERYRFFREVCGNGGIIATAHTLNDSAETQLFNLARGTGIKGLRGIPPMRGNIIRPLLGCTRDEIEDYCRENGLEYVTDSTNNSDVYARNRLRRHVIPVLEGINPAFLWAAQRTAAILSEEDDFLEYHAGVLAGGLNRDDGYSAEAYRKLHKAMQKRILHVLCRENGVSAPEKRIMQMDALIQQGRGAAQLSANCFFSVKDGIFKFTENRGQEITPAPVFIRLKVEDLRLGVKHNLEQ
ncbi:MAG: tRNA lysidine(34) synthetase TilS, partial [Oscillospiraceae bacterium]|nr:tRNA lysidine(34) synthetase TilS [Oscillospiraceae bacterium]